MNGSSNNDNEVIVLTQDITYPPVTPSKQQPLSNNNSPTPSFKSLNGTTHYLHYGKTTTTTTTIKIGSIVVIIVV